MRRLFAIIVAAIAFIGCSMDDITVSYQTDKSDIYYASFEDFGEESRTYVDENVKLLWHEDDRISLFRTTLNEQFKFTGATGDNSGGFALIESDEWVTGNVVSTNYAVYPYDATTKLSNDEIIQLTMPAVQHYAENSFGRGANTMVAASENTSSKFLPFRNLGGYIIVKLYGEDTTIKSIEFKGNNEEVIAGAATAEAKYGYLPVVTMLESGTTTITLDCGEEGVTISSDSANPTSFWFVVPPITFEGGFTFTITDINGNTFTKSTTKSQTVVRNEVKSMSGFETTFEGEGEDPEVATKPANNEIWYKSIDGNKTAPYRYPSDTNSLVSNTYSEDLGYWILEYKYDISKIDVETFMSCTEFTEIVLPDSITTINEDAFAGTSNLKKIHLPANLKLIQYQAFYSSAVSEIHIEDLDAWCGISMADKSFGGSYSLYIDNEPLTNVEIPENITSLSYRAFWHCKSVEHLKLHDNFTKIDGYAFNSNTNLQTVDLGDSIEEIGRFSFAFCDKLTTITIPESVTKIGDSAFKGCSSLSGIYCESTTPPGIYDWSDNDELWIAFDDIADNALIYVPAESVDKYKTASGWSRYEDIIVGYNFETGEIVDTTKPANNEIWYSTTDGAPIDSFDVGDATIVSNIYQDGKGVITCDKDITYIKTGDRNRLTSLIIPNGVTSIGSLSDCTNLQKLVIPNSVALYNYHGYFDNCTGELIVNCNIPSPGYAGETLGVFSGSKFSKVTIGDDVKFIGTRAFFGCNTIQSIHIGKGVNEIGYYTFYNCQGEIYIDCNIPDSVNTTYGGAFYGSMFSRITIGDNVSTIGEMAFKDITTITEINIPKGVTEIRSTAFSGCSNLQSVYIEDLSAWCNITFRGSYANPLSNSKSNLYVNNEILTDLIIPDDITIIKEYAFENCKTLQSIKIHSGVTEINLFAFYRCSNLSNVYCYAINPPKAYNLSFDYGAARLNFYVPATSIDSYKAANGWCDSADYIFADTTM